MNVVTNFKWIEAANYDEMSKIAATIFIDQLKKNSETVLGLATGGLRKAFIKNWLRHTKQVRYLLHRPSPLTWMSMSELIRQMNRATIIIWIIICLIMSI